MQLYGVDEAALVENREAERSVDRLDPASDGLIVAAGGRASVRGQVLGLCRQRRNQAGDCERRREQQRRDVRMLPHVRTSLGPPHYQRTTRARRSLEDPRAAPAKNAFLADVALGNHRCPPPPWNPPWNPPPWNPPPWNPPP